MKNRDYDMAVGKLLGIFYLIDILNVLLKTTVYVPVLSDYATYILGIVFWGCFIIRTSEIWVIFRELLFGEVLSLLLVCLEIVLYNEFATEIVKRSIWLLAFCIPFFCLSIYIRNTERVLLALKPYVNLVSCICIFIVIYGGYTGTLFASGDYNMTIGYEILFPLMYHSCLGMKNKKYLVWAFLECFIMVKYGSRGPLLCFVIFCGLMMLYGKLTRKKALILNNVFFLVFMVAGYCLSIWWGKTSNHEVYVEYTSSRTINKLLNGEFFADSGRTDIWKEAIEAIKDKPFLGWGICGDIPAIGEYPHLLFLEILLDFGIILGGMACVLIFVAIIRTFLKTRFNDVLINMTFAMGIISLLLSHSYVQTVEFWIFMGLALRGNLYRNYGKKNF